MPFKNPWKWKHLVDFGLVRKGFRGRGIPRDGSFHHVKEQELKWRQRLYIFWSHPCLCKVVQWCIWKIFILIYQPTKCSSDQIWLPTTSTTVFVCYCCFLVKDVSSKEKTASFVLAHFLCFQRWEHTLNRFLHRFELFLFLPQIPYS